MYPRWKPILTTNQSIVDNEPSEEDSEDDGFSPFVGVPNPENVTDEGNPSQNKAKKKKQNFFAKFGKKTKFGAKDDSSSEEEIISPRSPKSKPNEASTFTNEEREKERRKLEKERLKRDEKEREEKEKEQRDKLKQAEKEEKERLKREEKERKEREEKEKEMKKPISIKVDKKARKFTSR